MGGELQRQRVIFVEQRVVQIIILIGELNGGLVEHNAFLHTVTGGEVTGGDIADDNFQRNDRDLFYQRFALGELLDKVRRDTGFLHSGHQTVRHLVVDNALACDGAFFQAVQRRCVILVVDDDERGVIRGVDLLRLAFVNLL